MPRRVLLIGRYFGDRNEIGAGLGLWACAAATRRAGRNAVEGMRLAVRIARQTDMPRSISRGRSNRSSKLYGRLTYDSKSARIVQWPSVFFFFRRGHERESLCQRDQEITSQSNPLGPRFPLSPFCSFISLGSPRIISDSGPRLNDAIGSRFTQSLSDFDNHAIYLRVAALSLPNA